MIILILLWERGKIWLCLVMRADIPNLILFGDERMATISCYLTGKKVHSTYFLLINSSYELLTKNYTLQKYLANFIKHKPLLKFQWHMWKAQFLKWIKSVVYIWVIICVLHLMEFHLLQVKNIGYMSIVSTTTIYL